MGAIYASDSWKRDESITQVSYVSEAVLGGSLHTFRQRFAEELHNAYIRAPKGEDQKSCGGLPQARSHWCHGIHVRYICQLGKLSSQQSTAVHEQEMVSHDRRLGDG